MSIMLASRVGLAGIVRQVADEEDVVGEENDQTEEVDLGRTGVHVSIEQRDNNGKRTCQVDDVHSFQVQVETVHNLTNRPKGGQTAVKYWLRALAHFSWRIVV